MVLLDVSIVNVALPSIQIGLGAAQSQLQWVVSGLCADLRPAARPGRATRRPARPPDDVRRSPWRLFTLASAACGAAQNSGWLVIARLVQGLAGGTLTPQISASIQELFRGRERGKAFGYFGATVGLSHRGRAAARRPAHRGFRRHRGLACGLLRQRPDRSRRDAARLAAAAARGRGEAAAQARLRPGRRRPARRRRRRCCCCRSCRNASGPAMASGCSSRAAVAHPARVRAVGPCATAGGARNRSSTCALFARRSYASASR